MDITRHKSSLLNPDIVAQWADEERRCSRDPFIAKDRIKDFARRAALIAENPELRRFYGEDAARMDSAATLWAMESRMD